MDSVLSLLPRESQAKRKRTCHRSWDTLAARLGYGLANVSPLAGWHGLSADESGFVRVSVIEFSL